MGGQSNENNQNSSWKRFTNFIIFTVACLLVAEVSLAITIATRRVWHAQFTALLHASWRNLTGSVSSNTLGFAMDYVAIPLLLFCGSLITRYIWKGREEFWKNFRELVFSGLAGAMLVVFWFGAMFGWNLVKTIYADHASLISERDSAVSEQHRLEEELHQKPKVITKFANPLDEKLKITTRAYGKLAADGERELYFIEGTTNKTITPIRARLTCNHEFTVVGGLFLITESHLTVSGLHGTQIDAMNFEYDRNEPAWTPDRPLTLNVLTKAGQGISCQWAQLP